MPSRSKKTSSQLKRNPDKTLRVLLVNGDPKVRGEVNKVVLDQPIVLTCAASLDDARSELANNKMDLALIDLEQPDGQGLDLAAELAGSNTSTQSIMIGSKASFDNGLLTIPPSATDFICKPFDSRELAFRITQAKLRVESQHQQHRKVKRLKRVCRKLNRVRKDVAQQVDILCQDLVTAYHELAVQMNQVMVTSEFAGLIHEELDLEQFLRKALEFLLQKAGPTNAAIFLPSSGDEYSLGGYVNYDCSSDSADILLEGLADVLVPRIANHDQLLHLTDRQDMIRWLDGESEFMADSHMIGFTCRDEQESLAVVVLFRDGTEPFNASVVELCESIAPMCSEYLAKLIRIHHRHIVDDGPDSAWDE